MSKKAFYTANAAALLGGVLCVVFAAATGKNLPASYTVQIGEPVKVILNGIGEALVVAAVLAFSVDSYLKTRLTEEVSNKVIDRTSTYLMSFELPRAIQDDVDHLCRLPLMYVNYTLDYMFEETGPAGFLRLTTTQSFEVVNLRHSEERFTHYVSVFSYVPSPEHQPRIILVAGENLADPPRYRAEWRADAELGQLDEKEYERTWKREVTLPRRASDTNLPRFRSVTREIVPVPYVETFLSRHVRLNPEVRIHAPEWLFVEVTFGHRDQERVRKEPEARPMNWRLAGALLPGSAISIEWARIRKSPLARPESKPMDGPAASPTSS
jgi:hypothetical protein